MTNMSAVRAVNRFGLGARPGELAAIGGDPRGWLQEQVRNPKLPAAVAERHGGPELLAQGLKALRGKKLDDAEKNIKKSHEIYAKETGARILAQLRSDQPFAERLVMFWSNHFTVSIQKPLIAGIVNQYEVEAIRPHTDGYFHEMLVAVIRHPAMLIYLDNAQSFGPNSALGGRRGKGLNENLAREILELHTLGVDGGYGQEDVVALARIITGWSLDYAPGAGAKGAFRYQPAVHEPGRKMLLGREFKEDGEREGIEALLMLARHPATARHIAAKLARHFIADNPAQNSVAAIAESFRRSDGHLPTVMETIIGLDETWARAGSKIRTPYEFMIAALRLTGVEPSATQAIKGLEALNYRTFNASSPAGYDDVASAWAAPDSIMKRLEWGHRLAQRLPAGTDPLALAQAAFGAELSALTRQGIGRAPSGVDGLALLFASPEFQRR